MDTAGQEEYSSLRDQYMKTGQGFVLVYSITSPTSFEAAGKLRVQILRIKEEFNQDVPIVLVGNKADLEEDRAVTTQEGKSMAKKFRCAFVECSAKTNQSVSDVFFELVRQIQEWRKRHPESAPAPERKKKGGCVLF